MLMKKYYVFWTGNIYAGAIGNNTVRLEGATDDGLELSDFSDDEEIDIPEKMVISIYEQDIERDMPQRLSCLHL
jgi:hypothetical protein